LFRRHFFLIVAVIVVVAMGIAGTLKVMGGKKPGAGAGGPGAAAGGPGGARGGAGGPGGPGGRGGGAVVSPAIVSQRIFTDRLDVQGVAKGRQSVTLTATGGQVVDKVLFKSGDRVRKGQVLLELRKDAEDAAISQAQASVDLAKSTADRWNKLAAQGLAPAATAEQYQSAYITSKATMDAAKARLQDRVISAPFAGMVGLSDIAPGALISPGTAIVTLDDTSVITVDIDVPDRNLSFIKEGVGIDATSDSYPGEHYAGRIAKIDTRIDERSRSFKARAELPNPGGRLKPGMLLHVGIDRGTHQGLAAPESAVQYSAGQASVYMIVARGGNGANGAPGGNARPAGQPAAGAPAGAAPGGAPGAAGPGGGRPGGGGGGFVALQRPIVAGIDECGFVEVKDGLVLGDRIVADGLNKLTPNQPITLGGFGRGGGRGGPAAGPGGARGPGQPGGGAAGAQAGAGQPVGGQAAAGPEGGRRGGAPGEAGARMGAAAGRGEGRGPGGAGVAGRGGAGGPGAGRGRGGAQSVGVAAGNGASSRCAAQQPVGRGGPGGPGGPGAPGGGRGGQDAAAAGGQRGGLGGEGRRGRGEGGMPPAGGRGPGGGAARRGVETAQ
jgi:membrane fusion protein (multidrug efflux system)